MPTDTDEELKRLETELLKEDTAPQEEPEDILDDPFIRQRMEEGDPDETRFYGAGIRAEGYNTDRTDVEPDEISGELEEEPEDGSIRGLLITAVCLSAGILLVLLWWHLRGIF